MARSTIRQANGPSRRPPPSPPIPFIRRRYLSTPKNGTFQHTTAPLSLCYVRQEESTTHTSNRRSRDRYVRSSFQRGAIPEPVVHHLEKPEGGNTIFVFPAPACHASSVRDTSLTSQMQQMAADRLREPKTKDKKIVSYSATTAPPALLGPVSETRCVCRR